MADRSNPVGRVTRPCSRNNFLLGQVLASTVLEGDRAEGWQLPPVRLRTTPPSQNRRPPWVGAECEASERLTRGDVGAGGLAHALGRDPVESRIPTKN
jgi:hypothetical protein